MTVRRELQKTSGREIAIGSVYATLDRLERKGYVSSSRSDPDPVRGGRSRRHFQVEQRGLTALAQTRSLLDRMWDGVSIDPDSAR
jgi:DNA-binding PadR family transcriptional regulator